MRRWPLERSTRWVVIAFAVASAAACGDADNSSHGPQASAPRNSLSQFQAFGELLTRFYSSEFDTPENVDALVSHNDFVVLGEFESVVGGRKEYLGGCEAEQCPLESDATFYASYVNLEIRPLSVLLGSLNRSDSDIFVELPWPNNLDLQQLQDEAPTGARVIVVGTAVADPLGMSGPLIQAGIASKESVRDNLLTVADFGLIFENDVGSTVLPLVDCVTLNALVKDGDARLQSFDDAEKAIADAVSH